MKTMKSIKFKSLLLIIIVSGLLYLSGCVSFPPSQNMEETSSVSETAQEALNNGTVYYQKGNYDMALAEFTKALKFDPNVAEVYNDRGLVYRHKGNYDQAISDYNQAIKLDPKYAIAYYNRAVAYYYQKEYDKAWADVHILEALGESVDTGFLKKLKEASGKER